MDVGDTLILCLPTEVLWIIASTLSGGDISAFARAHPELYPKLRLALIKYNIKRQNSSALHWAAKTNNCAFAKTLLAYRADVNALIDDSSPLMTAVEYGSELVINLLLRETKLRVNMRNARGQSALWHGVAKKSSAIVNQLLQHPRVKIDRPNCEGQTVLWLAVFQGDRDSACLLLSRGANPDTKDRDGISPWIQACISNRSSIKDLFLDHWKATSSITSSNDTTIAGSEETVFSAASSGDISRLRVIRRRGERLDIVDQEGKTPLHTAASGGHLVAVDFLLRHANSLLNCKDTYGRTALWWSTFAFHDSVTKRLLKEEGVEVNALGRSGRYNDPSTSLHHLAFRRDTIALRWFLGLPALDPNLRGGSQSPLCLAIQEGNTAVVELLLAHKKTQINAITPHSDSPLLLATQKGHVDMVKLLIWQGDRLQINQLHSPDEETALFVAIRHRRLDILDILLEHPRIDLDLINRWGETALLLAVRQEDSVMVSRLLEGPKVPDNLALPAEVAKSRKNRDLGNLIEEAVKQKTHSRYVPRQGQLQIQTSRVGSTV
ncbi:hypothetical protein N7513_001891 [Penicillium frequentans]|nr:hypothetical protein N7513_001891 [Penicillium glabrum]